MTKRIFFSFNYLPSFNASSSSTHLAQEAQDLKSLLDSACSIFHVLPVEKSSSKKTTRGRHPSPSKPTSLTACRTASLSAFLTQQHWRASASLTGHPRWGRISAGAHSLVKSHAKGTEILCNTKRTTLGSCGTPQRLIMQHRRVSLSQQITVTSLSKGKQASQVIPMTDQLHQ